MSSIFGKNFRISIFGEAASDAIGVIVEGIEAGTKLDFSLVRRDLDRYAKNLSSPFEKNNICRIMSGCINDKTTGSPLCITIENSEAQNPAFNAPRHVFKPSGADLSLFSKFGQDSDFRDSGHSSFRMNVAFVVAGSIAKQILYNFDILVGSHIYSIGKNKDHPFDPIDISPDLIYELSRQSFPLLNQSIKNKMIDDITEMDKLGDTLGGSIECVVANLKGGVGDPLFRTAGSVISSAVFSISQACGIEFGLSELSFLKGSTANDPLYISGGSIKTKTNNYGGLNAGMTNGMPLIFRVMFAPSYEILIPQQTVNIKDFENTTLELKNNRSSCLIPSLVPVLEGMVSIAVLDLIL